jgi:hypothetical protein
MRDVLGVNSLSGRHGNDLHSGLLGRDYLITGKIIWDAGLEIGMNKTVPDFRLTTGVTWLFEP